MSVSEPEKLKVAIADDEPLSLMRLSRGLEQLGCEVVAKFSDGGALVEWLQSHDMPQALFLDVKMPGASGLDVLAEFSNKVPIVLVTSGAEFAVPAFDFAATDFLLKPVAVERLVKALERVRKSAGVTAAALPQPVLRVPVLASTGTLLLEIPKISHFNLIKNAVWA